MKVRIFFIAGEAGRRRGLTPTFLSKSLTMLRADILADGVNGELLPYVTDSAVCGKEGLHSTALGEVYTFLSPAGAFPVSTMLRGRWRAVTWLVGEGVVQPFAQRGGGEGHRRLNGRVRLHIVLRRRAGSRHPVYIRLLLTDSQLLPQI